MKRQLISLMIILPLLSLFSSLEVYAQGERPNLPIVVPPPPSKSKPGRRSASRTTHALSLPEYMDQYKKIY
jgi:hypothetical protein